MRRTFPFAALLLVTAVAGACRSTPTTTPELQQIVASATPPRGVEKRLWKDLQRFYTAREQRLAWLVADGVTDQTGAALDALRSAEAHGLDPSQYGVAELQEAATGIAATNESEDNTARAMAIATLDVRITAALLQLGRHVGTGRLTPQSIDARWNSRRDAPDYVAALQAAAGENVASFFDAVQPKHPEYQALRTALASLRGQAAEGWPSVPRASLKLGQQNAAVVPLRQRLAAGGYLRPGAVLDSPQFDADIESALKAFQSHHRLSVTGTLDRATLDALNVPARVRIAQVAMNLERWRWLPDDLGARHFLVNVPYFHLIAREHGKPVLDMRVVVGKRGNETPLFSDKMETVVFSPYWNVPETIALEETAPAVASDPDFLARNNMEVINAAGQVVSADAIPWGDPEALEDFRFRQRPGPDNALGYVKFLFPNEHAVYLHDTPADALFKRIGRAFSHGCVRVEEPERLAQYVLRDQPEWTAEAIRAAMRAGDERHVKLAAPIPVHIVYLTAWVDEQGGLHFEDDVYGYDARQARQ
jgi:murein L,D-transpeptidase YcbB/YkuD